MNRLFYLIFIVTTTTNPCPTCMGRITLSSPPFFNDEFYKPTTDNMDELYQAILALRKETVVTTTTPTVPQERK